MGFSLSTGLSLCGPSTHGISTHRGSAPTDVRGSYYEGCKQSVKLSSEAINVFLMCEVSWKQRAGERKLKACMDADGAYPAHPLLPRLSGTLVAWGGRRRILLGFPFDAITAESPCNAGKKKSRMLQPASAALPSDPLFSYHSEPWKFMLT